MGRLGRFFKRHIFWTIVTVVVLSPFFVQLSISASEKIRWETHPDHEALEETCSLCHSHTRPRQYAKSPDEWINAINRMLENAPDEIRPEEKKKVE